MRLPVVNRGLVDSDPDGNISLQQPKIEPSPPYVIS